MEPFVAYGTKDGWRNDWYKTRASFQQKATDISDYVKSEKGSSPAGCLIALALAPVGAVAFGYAGAGLGWAWGHLVDVVPLVRDAAPYIAQKTGLIKDAAEIANFNVEFYQASGAVTGFWSGFWFPARVLAQINKE